VPQTYRVFKETKRRSDWQRAGLCGNVIRTGLMLNSTKDHVDELIKALDAGIALCLRKSNFEIQPGEQR